MSPAVLVLDDEPASVNLLRITLGMDYEVHTATDGESALRLLAAHPEIAVAIIDQRMPGMTGTEFIQRTVEPYPQLVRIILTGFTDIESLIQAINAGRVYRYLTKPWNRDELLATVRQGLEVHALASENQRLQAELRAANARLRVENAQLKREAKGRYRFDELVGSSAAMQKLLGLIERVVQSDATVLITGETGTGKELVARAIHYNGPRADRPFVSENCGALSPELLSSELFGHRKGAFTGATEDRQGLFEVANGGTLFLDEIGDCPPDLQTRLLRVLDQGEVRRVGDNTPIPVDVRILAATHHDLERDVAEGRFRKDLFFRLSVITVQTPPLRERREDVPLLAAHFVERLAARSGRASPGFTADALAQLGAYDFPGNVRELEKIVERAWTLGEPGSFLTPDLLPEKLAGLAPAPVAADGLRGAVERCEAQCIREALQRNHNNQTRTAEELGVSRRALIDKLNKYGIGR
ncbi:MAG: sigma-54 dependent transcriptional regulator [Deltaproteobacteria bacterium]|nr:sigma-54 dependent transcriptional regulator [Deltaproteobacteria bacterium]